MSRVAGWLAYIVALGWLLASAVGFLWILLLHLIGIAFVTLFGIALFHANKDPHREEDDGSRPK